MSLNTDTVAVQTALTRQRIIAETCAREWRRAVACTDTDLPAWVDAIFARDGIVTAVAEIRDRQFTLARLRRISAAARRRRDAGDANCAPPGYIVTYGKLLRCRKLAQSLGAKFVVIASLNRAEVAWWLVSDELGRWRVRFERAYTKTRATANGGIARRQNAYLSLDDMRLLKEGATDGTH